MWLRLVRAPKLIDRFRTPWAFEGILVKFKLEVGISEAELLQVAEQSRNQSAADLMVANTLDGAKRWAYPRPARRELRTHRQTGIAGTNCGRGGGASRGCHRAGGVSPPCCRVHGGSRPAQEVMHAKHFDRSNRQRSIRAGAGAA
ncbi:MAG: hypothetical protein U0791_09285 [Gemmataceae bacterium]